MTEAPRASNLNGATNAEPDFIAQYGPALTAKGETINQVAASSPLLPPYIGSAMVVRPSNPDWNGGG